MKIYLLRRSLYNEDFLLEHYATNDNEICQIIKKYWQDYYNEQPKSIDIYHGGKTIIVNGGDYDITFWISELEPIST